MISACLADICKRYVLIGLANHENTALLPRVAFKTSLPVSGFCCAKGIAQARKFKSRCDASFESSEFVGLKLRVDVDREGEFFIFDEGLRLMGFSITHDNKLCPALGDLMKFVSQLRDLLAAEESAKVPDENEHRVLVLPSGGEGQ